MLDLFCIAVFWWVVLELLSFYDTFMEQTYKFIFRNDPRGIPPIPRIKPFSCNTCMTFWTGLIWLILHNDANLRSICVLSVFSAYSSPVFGTFNAFFNRFLAILIKKKHNA